VPGWEEVTRLQGGNLGHTISLLQQTNAGSGYPGYTIPKLLRKMRSPDSSPSVDYPGLRVWRHTTLDLVAVFILRAYNSTIFETPAYALTVGLSKSIVTSVYNELLPLCQWMIGQPPQRIEILSEYLPINHPVLKATFDQIPSAKILGTDSISPGAPWVDNLHRWRLAP